MVHLLTVLKETLLLIGCFSVLFLLHNRGRGLPGLGSFSCIALWETMFGSEEQQGAQPHLQGSFSVSSTNITTLQTEVTTALSPQPLHLPLQLSTGGGRVRRLCGAEPHYPFEPVRPLFIPELSQLNKTSGSVWFSFFSSHREHSPTSPCL